MSGGVRGALLERTVFVSRRRLLHEKIARFATPTAAIDIERYQLARVNSVWSHCLADIPFYRTWREEHGLPRHISGLAELADFPVLDKHTIVDRAAEVFGPGSTSSCYITGGSTGRPTRYPRGPGEAEARYANAYLTRSWYGIRPFDSNVLIWGHSHLFGAGVKGRVKRIQRRSADRLLNIHRLDAYSLHEQTIRAHCDTMRRVDPVYLIGYTSSIFQLARYVERHELQLAPAPALKAVIVTAETVADTDIEVIQRVFGVPVMIEYGSAEAGVMATSAAAVYPLKVIWDSFVFQTHGQALNITTLDNRLFPLVNYSTGDLVDTVAGNSTSVLELEAVTGRGQNAVRLRGYDGSVLDFSGTFLIHILRLYPGMLGIQFRRQDGSDLAICLQSERDLDMADVSSYFAHQLRHHHPNFDPRSVSFTQVGLLTRSQAGKQTIFIP